MMRPSVLRTLMLGGASFLAQSVLSAQEASAQTQAKRSELEEIIVTATRRETNLQETPAAVTTFGAGDLASVPDLVAISAAVPNTEFVRSPTGFLAYIRGVGNANASIDGDQNVAVYLDGVYLEKGYGADMDLADVARVEVIRGPQGTLYGRNATAGAVNIVLAEPGDTLNGSVSVSAGNFDSRQVRATIGGPITDRLGGRLSFSQREHDGYVKNLSGPDVQDEDQSSVRGMLTFDLTDRVNLRFTGDYSRSEDNNVGWKLVADDGVVGSVASLFGLTVEIPSDFWTLAIDNSTAREVELWGTAMHANIELSTNLGLKSITAYRSFNRYQNDDLDGTNLPPVQSSVLIDDEDVQQFSQEFQLHGQWERFDWVGGVFYYDMDSAFASPLVIFGLPALRQFDQTTKAWALFSDIIVHVTDRLDLQGGLRYSDEEKTYVSAAGADYDKSWSDVTPRIGASYRVTDNVMVFANIADGFKSGGFNEENVSANMSTTVDPETLRSYELGVKTRWFDDRLHLNATAFHYDYDDLQVQSFVLAGGTLQQILSNAGTARTRGVEVEFDARPMKALSLGGFVSYLDAEFTDFSSFDPGTGDPLALSGNTMPYAPNWKCGLRGRYEISVAAAGTLAIGARYTWTDEFFHSEFNEPNATEHSHENVSASVRFSSSDERWSAEIFGDNLTDEERAATRIGIISSADPIVIQAPPRTYGVRIGYAF